MTRGAAAASRPAEVSAAGGIAVLVALAVFSAVLLPLSRSHGFRIVRWEGAGLVVAYLGCMAWRPGADGRNCIRCSYREGQEHE